MANEVSSTSSYSYLQTSSGRISGLVSGMDTESLVEKLMKAESAKMEKLQQQQQKYEWQRDAYRSVNTKLQTFSDDLFNNYSLQKNFMTKTATVSDSSKVSVSPTATASGTMSLDYVKQLATSATSGVKDITAKGNTLAQGSNKLSEIDSSLIGGTFNFAVTTEQITKQKVTGDDGVEKEVEVKENVTTNKNIVFDKDDTIDTFVNKLKAEGVDASFQDGKLSFGTTNITIPTSDTSFASKLGVQTDATGKVTGSTQLTGAYKLQTNSTLKDVGISTMTADGDKPGTVTLGVLQSDGTMKSVNISYSETDTIDSFVKKLNGVGVSAIFSNGQMSISANNTGSYSGGSIQVRADTNKGENALFNKLGFISGTSEVGAIADNGKDAIYAVNGIEMTSKTNNFTVSGYSVTAKQTFGIDSAGNQIAGEQVSVSSTVDVDAMMDKIKTFVNSYNDLITSLNSQTKEKKNTSYPPLTEAQKSEMTTDQITKWEEKAKAGILRNDTYINKFVSDARKSIYQKVDAVSNEAYNTIYKIGITTTDTYADGGKLQIDEDKLRAALTNDPDSVMTLFTDSSTGIAKNLRDAAKSAISSVEKQAGKTTSTNSSFTIGKRLDELTTKIDDWKERLKDIESRYWNQFTAMEKAIQDANTQSSLFMQ